MNGIAPANMHRWLWLTALAYACGGEAVIDGTSATGAAGPTPTTTTTSTSSTTTSTTTTSTSTKTCPDCLSSEYCDYPDNHCGLGAPATCEPRPQGCSKELLPTCACDGQIYDNPCLASIAGHDVSNDEICTPPLDTFACGSIFCGFGTDYCLVQISDIGGWPDDYSCNPLPPGCYTPNCACLELEPCGYYCEQDADGSLTLTCPGG